MLNFRICAATLALTVIFAQEIATAQGTTAFQNLDSESANVSGFSPRDQMPVNLAMPGWSVYFGVSQAQTVGFDFISLSVASISILDSQLPPFSPLQGNHSAFLQGSGSAFGSLPATISQIGLVPSGTRSLVVDMYWEAAPPVVTLGGQTITMVPIKTFPTYILYAGNIAAFAGQTAALSFTAPPPSVGSPSSLELDNISFSTAAIPEPGSVAQFLLGVLFVGGMLIRRGT